ncbi:isocitrate/isopropylmalate dehydrogenase family protein [bacterium]|nr:isocitrate/isopropylmalate dehydrogenase family protein [bacterium]
MNPSIQSALSHIQHLLEAQLHRVDQLAQSPPSIDLTQSSHIRVGICPGDGIGPVITEQAHRVMAALVNAIPHPHRTIEFIPIEGLTLERRLAEQVAIPADVLAQLRTCDVVLKGPTTTPQAGSGVPNIESANVAMRRELDLFANVRPVVIPDRQIDWTFFRENTEGEYMLGSHGIHVTPELSLDFKVTTEPGCMRIIRAAFEFAKQNNKKRVAVVTKSNVIKTTDGHFSRVAHQLAADYVPHGIQLEEWYVDIMAAKLIDPSRQADFDVLVMPNLYGDILTDEAAQLQGGVGTAGSANIGSRWAMFEGVHGSAPRMVTEGRAVYADPSSMLKASAMLLRHIGWWDQATALDEALSICTHSEKQHVMTGRANGATASQFGDYVLSWALHPDRHDRYTQGIHHA